MLKFLKYFVILILFTGCNSLAKTKVSNSQVEENKISDEIYVLNKTDKVSNNALELGDVKIPDSVRTQICTYEEVLESAKQQVKRAGGNTLKIIYHSPPDKNNSCHRIEGKILKIENLKSPQSKVASTTSGTNHAMLYTYRPNGVGSPFNYELYLNDNWICTVKNRSYCAIKINRKGKNLIWVQSKTKKEVFIDVEFGKSYYLRCTVEMDQFKPIPEIELVSENRGKLEYGYVVISKN